MGKASFYGLLPEGHHVMSWKKIKLFLFALKRSKPHPKPLSPDREGGRGREDGHERDT